MSSGDFVTLERIKSVKRAYLATYCIVVAAMSLMFLSAPLIVLSAIFAGVEAVILLSILCGISLLTSIYLSSTVSAFGRKRRLLTVMYQGNLKSVQQIAEASNFSEASVREMLQNMIGDGYLPGWKFDRNRTKLISTRITNVKCPHCGAPHNPENERCEHCNNIVPA